MAEKLLAGFIIFNVKISQYQKLSILDFCKKRFKLFINIHLVLYVLYKTHLLSHKFGSIETNLTDVFFRNKNFLGTSSLMKTLNPHINWFKPLL